jgi:outer membrane protein assembly factor BamB
MKDLQKTILSRQEQSSTKHEGNKMRQRQERRFFGFLRSASNFILNVSYKRANLPAKVFAGFFGVFLFLVAAAPSWSAIAIDVSVSTNRSSSSTSITSPSFSTASTNELLLAFVATDGKSSGMTVTGVTGGSLTWALVRRTNTQLGTAEIWRAFASARLTSATVQATLSQSVAATITVVSFTGTDTSGTSGSGAIGATGSGNASSGAPTASLVTTRNNSWVFGVGCDWDNATQRTLGPNQTMVNQYLATVGDTYWIQRQNASTAASGTTVTINDTAPSTDRYNLTIVEVLPAVSTYTVSGTISPAALASGATVTLGQSGTTIATATVDASGNYSFAGVANGTYTVTPGKSGYTFSPASQSVTVNGSAVTVPAFTAAAIPTWTISGTISPAAAGSGTLLTLSGGAVLTTTADSSGNYTFNGLVDGTYTVTPSKSGYTFSPPSLSVPVSGANVTGIDFTAQAIGISGSDWLTYGHDPQRSGNAAGESMITTTSVKNLTLKWSAGVDGKVTAQPLFVSATPVGGQTRDVVIVVTASNSVYALDAASGTQLWYANFGPSSGSGAVPGGFGISGAPVIDRNRGLIYTVTDNGRLHTLNLADGTEASPALPVVLDSLNPPVLSNTATNMVWGGLNLVNNNLYITTASDGDDTNPWWGRIMRIDVSGAAPAVAGWFKVVPGIATPNGGGGIWGFGGVSVDSLNRVFAATSADSKPWSPTVPEGYTPYAGRLVALAADLGYSAVTNALGSPLGSYEPPHPSPCPGAPGVCDMDFGATPVVFQPSSCATELTAAGNKDGHVYVLPVNDLATSVTTSLQSLALNIAYDGPGAGGITGVPAFWPAGNMLFVTDGGPGINGINAGVVGLTASCSNPPNYLQVAWSVALAAANDQPPSAPTVANGVVFVGSGLNGSVHAYDATNGTELWNSGSAIAGGATFAAPMVASGSLYVASWNGFNTGDSGTIRSFGTGSAPPPPASGVLLGDETVESVLDSNALGNAEAFQATATASGTVSTLSIYLDASSTATTMFAGIYTNASGHPGALIAQGSSSQLKAGAWNTVPIPGAIVTSGTPYWIAILGTQSGILKFRDGTANCVSETSGQTNLTALPSTWVTGKVWPSCPLSAYGSSGP